MHRLERLNNRSSDSFTPADRSTHIPSRAGTLLVGALLAGVSLLGLAAEERGNTDPVGTSIAWVSEVTPPAGCSWTHYTSLSDPLNNSTYQDIRVDINYQSDPGGLVQLVGASRSSYVTVSGGWPSCDAAAPTGETHLYGNPNGQSPTIYIDGSNGHEVRFEDMVIRNGGGSDGGGLKISGWAVVTLYRTRVFNNTTNGTGGGIGLFGDQEDRPVLNVMPESVIDYNIAGKGGGIGCIDADIHFFGGEISSNEAVDPERASGAGLYLDNCLVTHEKLPAYSADLSITHNAVPELGYNLTGQDQESYGAGLYVVNGSQVSLGRRDAETVVGHNALYARSDETGSLTDHPKPDTWGGGFYISDNSTRVDLLNVAVESNSAYGGGAFDIHGGAVFSMTGTPGDCVGTGICSALRNNHAVGFKWDNCLVAGGNENIYGGVGGVFRSAHSDVSIHNTEIRDNRVSQHTFDFTCVGGALNLVQLAHGGVAYVRGGTVSLSNSLVVGNDAQYGLFDIKSAAVVEILHTTITRNQDNGSGAKVFIMMDNSDMDMTVANSIVHNDELEVIYHYENINYDADFYCNVVESTAHINAHGNGVANVVANPGFVGGGDYGLTDGSTAVDLCDNLYHSGNLGAGLDGMVRPIDHANIDELGIYDAGAYENRNGSGPRTAELAVTIPYHAQTPAGTLVELPVEIYNDGTFTSYTQQLHIETQGLSQLTLTPGEAWYWSCAQSGDDFDCTGHDALFGLGVGQTKTLTLQGVADTPNGGNSGLATIYAEIAGDYADVDPENNEFVRSITVTGSVQANFDLQISRDPVWRTGVAEIVTVSVSHDHAGTLPVLLDIDFDTSAYSGNLALDIAALPGCSLQGTRVHCSNLWIDQAGRDIVITVTPEAPLGEALFAEGQVTVTADAFFGTSYSAVPAISQMWTAGDLELQAGIVYPADVMSLGFTATNWAAQSAQGVTLTVSNVPTGWGLVGAAVLGSNAYVDVGTVGAGQAATLSPAFAIQPGAPACANLSLSLSADQFEETDPTNNSQTLTACNPAEVIFRSGFEG